jgi:RND family efflux transporter MFP subunit
MKQKINPAFLIMMFLAYGITAGTTFAGDLAEFEGLIEPYETVNVGTPVEGVIAQVHVRRSSFVKKGDHLVNLESSVESAVVQRSRALVEVEGEINLQKERLAFAKRMNKRVEELFNSEAISAEKKDEAATEVTLSRARLLKANENRTLAKLDLERAQAMLDRRTIKSPISGIVVERFVSPGEFVDNQPLLRLAQMDPLRVEVVLPVEMFRNIKPGMKADIKPETQSEGGYSATVTIVDRVIDPASGTFGVRLELPNPDYRLPGGLKCTVRFLDDTVSPAGTDIDIEADKMADILQPKPLLVSSAQ